METKQTKRPPDDVTWFGDFGVALDIVDGQVDAAGNASGRGVSLVLVARDGSEVRVPGTLNANAALEVARLLMYAASLSDPSAVARVLSRARSEDFENWLVRQPMRPDVRTH